VFRLGSFKGFTPNFFVRIALILLLFFPLVESDAQAVFLACSTFRNDRAGPDSTDSKPEPGELSKESNWA
jgi:hypothetical protein